jgi:hypothetical protein
MAVVTCPLIWRGMHGDDRAGGGPHGASGDYANSLPGRSDRGGCRDRAVRPHLRARRRLVGLGSDRSPVYRSRHVRHHDAALRTQTQAAYSRSGFTEREYRREARIFGDIASIYSSFYIAIPQRGGHPLARGLHHFQLVKMQGCWRIVSNISQMEGGSWQLPAAFAPNSGSPTK